VLAPVVILPLTGRPIGPLQTLDESGREVPARLFWLGLKPDSAERPGTNRWLAPPGTWVSLPPERAGEAATGLWVLRLDLTRVAPGSAVRLQGVTLPLDWFDARESLPRGAEVLARAALAQPLERSSAEWLAATIEPMLASPLERWRAEPLLGLTRAAGVPAAAGNAGGGAELGVVRLRREADAVVDEFAAQTRRRWLAGLARLSELDLALAEQVASRLLGLVRFEDGDAAPVAAPVWPALEGGLLPVAGDLLDPRADRERVLATARGLLRLLPASVAWVVDDSAGGTGARIVQIGAANLAPAPVAAWADLDGQARGEPQRLEPGSAPLLALPAGRPDAQPGERSVLVRVGPGSSTLTTPGGAVGVPPAGLVLGPLVSDWTMPTWLQGVPIAAQPAASALLFRPVMGEVGAGDAAGSPRARGEGGWSIFIEAAWAGTGQARGEGDRVTLWFGPRGGGPDGLAPGGPAWGFISIEPSGRTVTLRAPRPGAPPVRSEGSVRVSADDRGWSAWVPLPEWAIEPGALVRLGWERRTPEVGRGAWPRAMLPWQPEPGRALLKLESR
jgi:hypothetical protein